MDEKRDGDKEKAIKRRHFIGALGAAAAAGVFLEHGAEGEVRSRPSYYYENARGHVVPVAPDTAALGVLPPLAPAPPTNSRTPAEESSKTSGGPTAPSSGYPKYNILLIMVDQMRDPTFWPPPGSYTSYVSPHLSAVIPHITGLMNQSYVFPNFYVCSSPCTPSRSNFLTGLYSQQTCLFANEGINTGGPALQPYANGAGFPTVANVLSQQNVFKQIYDCVWIGKWHLSCYQGNASDGTPGANGPSDYGFKDPYSLPTGTASSPGYGKTIPSPDGTGNEGNGGDFHDSAITVGQPQCGANVYLHSSVPNFPTALTTCEMSPPDLLQLNDAAIAYAFVNSWIPYARSSLSGGLPNGQPWFAAVSFVNPHDIALFPSAYAVTITDPAHFIPPGGTTPSKLGYQPPSPTTTKPTNFTGVNPQTDITTIPPLNGGGSYPLSPYKQGSPPANWNNTDDPFAQEYVNANVPHVKPGLQAYFQNQLNTGHGQIENTDTDGWIIFLNYYFWMQSCADYQIGQVISALQSASLWDNTLVIFTSDHGDFAGSHNLHSKGGALYNECINVPLFISFPEQRSRNQQVPTIRPYVCSSVDILPFIYSMALGNESWRSSTPTDLIGYLSGRESIRDAIYSGNSASQWRIAPGIPCKNGGRDQPYILHTADMYLSAYVPLNPNRPSYGASQPSHAIAFRTVDPTLNNYKPHYGGAKLGIYSYWGKCTTRPLLSPGNDQYPQYEFYDYSTKSNYAETGNDGVSSINTVTGETTLTTEAQTYLDVFNSSAVQNELYRIPAYTYIQEGQTAALCLFLKFANEQTTCTSCTP
jgi:arylsulfatase A-like enzyme